MSDLYDPAMIEALWQLATPEEREEIARLLESDLREHLWRPQVGRQSQAADSLADEVGYGGAAGGGKGLALDTPLPTPSGWTTMGDVKVGDVLLGGDGSPCTVIACSPVQHRPCYRLEFDDGSEIIADDVHRWLTITYAERVRKSGQPAVRDTAEIARTVRTRSGFWNHAIPLPRRRGLPFRYIVTCEPVDSVPTRCIAVNSPSRLFLAGRGAVPTHNTDLGIGLALTEHTRSVIFRREKAQTEGIVQRMIEIVGHSQGLNSQKGIWTLKCPDNKTRIIEFGGLDNPLDHQRWQGRAHDLKYYDEVTEMREFQVRFTKGWNRSSDPKQRCRVVMGFNPPTTREGRWVIDYFGPWLDDAHPLKAEPGELRYVTTIGGRDVWLDRPDPFVMFKGQPLYDFDPNDFGPEKIITPRSRTFIPSRTKDNFFYVRSGYISTLQALPEPLRSQMLEGNFKAGIEDDPWQVIPTAWIDAAMARWKPRDEKGVMDSMGVDPSAGGKDTMVIYRRHGTWFDQPIRIPGHEIPQERAGPLAAARVIEHRTDKAPVHADVIGWGLAMCNFLTANDVQVVPVNFAAASTAMTADGTLRFCNKRAEVIWRMREALDPANPNPVSLPPDPKLAQDLASYRWELRPAGVFIMPKEQQRRELGRSPDDGDACCLANMATLKHDAYEQILMVNHERDRYAELYE
jgi:hypothetical protein